METPSAGQYFGRFFSRFPPDVSADRNEPCRLRVVMRITHKQPVQTHIVTSQDPQSTSSRPDGIIEQVGRTLSSYSTNPYLWGGLGVLILAALLLFIALNFWLMPTYTRHGENVTVPDVINRSLEEARMTLEEKGLESEEVIMRKPNLPLGVVIDQNPEPFSDVKTGRRIYLTVNSGDTSLVAVPRVLGNSIREARNRMMIQGLKVAEVRPDSIPSAYANTITRQRPRAGEQVPPGTEINLWYSTGLGDVHVSIPNVVGLTAEEAAERLLDVRLRSANIGANDSDAGDRIVQEQYPAAGASVREGFVVRLHLR